MVEGVVAELPDRDDVAGLMEWPDDETGRAAGRRGQAGSGNALDGRGVPAPVCAAGEPPERDPLRNEAPGASGGNAVADGLEIGGDLPGEHLDEARAEHAQCRSRIGDVLLGAEG